MKTFPRVFSAFILLAFLAACGSAPTMPTATAVPAPTDTADPFDISVAQYFLDAAGFHDIAETLAETKTIDPTYFATVNRVEKVLKHTTWPSELNEQAQDFIKSLEKFAAALEADNVDEAIEDADTVHDAQHELSHAIDAWLGQQDAHSH